MEDKRKAWVRLGIIVAFCAFIILPLSLTLIANLMADNSAIPEDVALNSNVSEDVMQAIKEGFDADPSDFVAHDIFKSGDFVVTLVINTAPRDYGDSVLVILQNEDDKYEIIYSGQFYAREQLEEAGIPDEVINGIEKNSDLISKYLVAMAEPSVRLKSEYPLLNALPYSSDNLKIAYYYNDELEGDEAEVPIIEVSATDATERANALDVIKRFECDPGDYYIEFMNFINPFTGESR